MQSTQCFLIFSLTNSPQDAVRRVVGGDGRATVTDGLILVYWNDRRYSLSIGDTHPVGVREVVSG